MLYTPTNGMVSSPFGLRWGGTDWHGGIDFATSIGTPVFAAQSGTVVGVWANGVLNKYGRVIVLKHDDASPAPYSLYAHLSDSIVSKGQHVNRGQRIGATGNTGASHDDASRTVPPHLHFELLSKWPPPAPDTYRVNPTSYLDPAVFPKGLKPEVVGIGFGTLLLLGGGAYWFWKSRRRYR